MTTNRSGIDVRSLRRQRKRIMDDLRQDVEKKVRAIMLLLFRWLVEMTPVDTGRAASAWILTVDSPSDDVPPEGQGSYSPLDDGQEAQRFRLGMIAWIVNNVDYIVFLDEGSSSKAPAGMTPVAFANLQAVTER